MLLLLPTDTCYGLAGEFTEQDYNEIYQLKGRDFSKQLAILVGDYTDMQNYIDISDEQIEFLKGYPHPWSFLGKKSTEFILPDWMDSEKYQMLSIRVASVCLKISEKLEFPIYLTSANLSGMSESTTLSEARVCFPNVDGIDGGTCSQPPSDIFSIDGDGELQYVRRNYGIEK